MAEPEPRVVNRLASQAVSAYLDALDRGEVVASTDLEQKIKDLAVKAEAAQQDRNWLKALRYRQQEYNLRTNQRQANVEEEFIKVAASYSERNGISYAVWREMGVPARILNQAGIVR